MKKFKKILISPVTTLVLFIAAAALLLFSSIGGTRAALTASKRYNAEIAMQDLDVKLVENDVETENEALLTKLLGEDESLQIGKAYEERLAVANKGTIDQYVRVTITKYWMDGDGNKLTNLDPSLIELNWVNTDKWLIDESSTTKERTVLLYNSILPEGGISPEFTDTLTISNMLVTKVTMDSYVEDNGDGTQTTYYDYTYDYNGVQFRIEAKVDAVQTHHADDAILSAWGMNVSVADDGTLSLN